VKKHVVELHFTPVDNRRLSGLCGAVDNHLRQIEDALEVAISHRSERFSISGEKAQAVLAGKVLTRLYAEATDKMDAEDIELALLEYVARTDDAPIEQTRPKRRISSIAPDKNPLELRGELPLHTRRADLRARTDRQLEYVQQMQTHDITFGVGPAGTGKTYLAVAAAVDAFERDTVKRILLTRPTVEAGERLGYLPGDVSQKVDPFLRPLYDALYELMGFDKVARMFERNQIEVAPLAFMRGRTLNHSFIILDEAQNTTPEQMKMFLTRLGFGTKAVITGDVTQVDLRNGQTSGLIDARNVLYGVRGIGFTVFQAEDVVRHPLVQAIVGAYEANGRTRRTNER
jgi:phosphate starvation-inducible protein PhoH and related proteins